MMIRSNIPFLGLSTGTTKMMVNSHDIRKVTTFVAGRQRNFEKESEVNKQRNKCFIQFHFALRIMT